MTLVLETLRGDETLNAGSLGVWFLAFALGLDFTTDDELADLYHTHPLATVPSNQSPLSPAIVNSGATHIIILRKPKELPNLRRSLRPQPLWQHLIRQPRQLFIPLLNHTKCQHRQIHSHNTPPHRLPLPLSSTSRPIAAMPRTQQQPHTCRMHDTLLHWKPLLIVAASNFEDVAFELGTDAVTWDFLAHAAVHEDAEFAIVFDFDELLCAIGGEGDVKLHLDGWEAGVKMGGDW